ncbi:MAG: hypothetical protein R3E39_10285 [Anaerolineae bacterium]
MTSLPLPRGWQQPPAEFSLAPFWFWNDELDEGEIARQMADFQQHGVDAFVLHPRLGLPPHLGWMSRALLDKMHFAIREAHRRGMWVILYDEGMYPSGSSAGQVVAENAAYQCRGMVRIDLDALQPNTSISGVAVNAQGELALDETQTLLCQAAYNGRRYAVVERPIDSVIRGLHYVDESVVDASGESPESAPPATDLLNAEAVACFIRLVYDRFYAEFGDYFGMTIQAIFTDEPMLLGRAREGGVLPATRDILTHINAFLGYDFAPHLPALWDEDVPESVRRDYEQAVEHRFEQTYYQQLYAWCEQHHIALTGHPAEPDATRHLRYFHMPGQDIVWRQIEMDKPSALEGRQSTQGKAASSMMLHTGRQRNANEFCGAFGHSLTFEEVQWLANWLLVRGCNLLIPHAFYYTVRGPRKDERPPDIGPNSAWWDSGFTAFALACRRLAWLNTDSEQVCHVAIVGEHHHLPWRAAKDCLQHQIDFNYLDADDLAHCEIDRNRLHIGGQQYAVLVVDGYIPPHIEHQLKDAAQQLPVLHWNDDPAACLEALKRVLPPSPVRDLGAAGLRVRQVRKDGLNWTILFNEGGQAVRCKLDVPNAELLDPADDNSYPFTGELTLDAHALRVLVQKDIS